MDAAKTPVQTPQFRRGDIILRNRPWCYVVNDECAELVCHACFYRNRTLGTKRLTECTKCNFCRYCSPKCRLADQKHHALECQYLQNYRLLREAELKTAQELSSSSRLFPPASVRQLARAILRLERGEVADYAGDCVPSPEGGDWKFTDLMSHVDEIKAKDSLHMTGFLYVEPILRDYLKGNKYFASLSKADILEIYGRLKINGFGANSFFWDNFAIVGSTLCLGSSKFDHDCEPNARGVTRDDGSDYIIAIKDIDRFDQVRLSYINELDSTDVRQKQLQTRYFFTCTCRLCSSKASKGDNENPQRDDFLRSIRCAYNFDTKGRPKPLRACKHPCPVDKDGKPVAEQCEAGHAQKFPEETLKRARELAQQMEVITGTEDLKQRQSAMQPIFQEYSKHIHQYNKTFFGAAIFAGNKLDVARDLAHKTVLEALEGLKKYMPDSLDYTWGCCHAAHIFFKHGFLQDAEKVFNNSLPLMKMMYGENEETVAAMKKWFASEKSAAEASAEYNYLTRGMSSIAAN